MIQTCSSLLCCKYKWMKRKEVYVYVYVHVTGLETNTANTIDQWRHHLRQLQFLLCTFYWNFQDSKQANASRKPLIPTTCVSAPPQCTNTSQYLYSGVHTMKKDLVDYGPETLYRCNVMMMDHWKEMPGLAMTANMTLVYTEYLNLYVPVSSS